MKKIIALFTFVFLLGSITAVNAQDFKKFIPKKKEKTENTADSTKQEKGSGLSKFKSDLKKGFGEILGEEEAEGQKVEVEKVEVEVEKEKEEVTQSKNIERPTKEKEKVDYRSSESVADQGLKNMMGKMGIGPKEANVKPSYNFDAFIEMTISTYEGEKLDETMTYKTFLDSKSLDYCMELKDPEEESTTLMIFDTENNQMLTLAEADGEKSGFAIKFNPEQIEDLAEEYDDEEEIEDPYNFYKTGKKKKILGYTCEEYIIEDEESHVTMWVTDEVKKGSKGNYMKNSAFGSSMTYAGNTNGTVMEYIAENTYDNEKSVMTVTDIDFSHKHSISTAGYDIIEMGTGQGVLY